MSVLLSYLLLWTLKLLWNFQSIDYLTFLLQSDDIRGNRLHFRDKAWGKLSNFWKMRAHNSAWSAGVYSLKILKLSQQRQAGFVPFFRNKFPGLFQDSNWFFKGSIILHSQELNANSPYCLSYTSYFLKDNLVL